MTELIQCTFCSEEVTEDSDFCPHCGVLFKKAAEVLCDLHIENQGKGVCIICRSVVCDECGVHARGRMFCQSHRKVQVQQDWAEVFRSTEIADAELVKSVLETAGHIVQVQNFNSIGFVWDGGGDSPISRSNLNKPAKVFVPIPEYVDAKEEVEEWRSSQSDVYFDEAESGI
jgi:hypothetical protein